MANRKTWAALGVMTGSVALLVAACGGGGGSGVSTNTSGGTLTFSGIAGLSSIPGLSFYTPASSSVTITGGTKYLEDFENLSTFGSALITYSSITGVEDMMTFAASPNINVASPTWYYTGPPAVVPPACWVSGASNPYALPTCTSWGIAVSRAAGTISFTNTPVFNIANSAVAGTMSGSLTFSPF